MDEGDKISLSLIVKNVQEMVDLHRKNGIKNVNFIQVFNLMAIEKLVALLYMYIFRGFRFFSQF